MTPENLPNDLWGGGDCLSHWHSVHRSPSHDFLEGLQSLEKVVSVTEDYTVALHDDYIFADTTLGDVDIYMPEPRGGLIYTVVKVAGGNNVTLHAFPGTLINGQALVHETALFKPRRFKADVTYGMVEV